MSASTPPTVDAGSGTDGGSTGGAGDTGTGVDAGPQTGPTGRTGIVEASDVSTDCAGVLPTAIPASHGLIVPHQIGELCVDATTDQQGNIAASHAPADNPFGRSTWEAFSSAGDHSGAFATFRRPVFPQDSGFQGVVMDGNTPAMRQDLVQWDAVGRELRRTEVGGGDGFAGIPHQSSVGGTLVVNQSTNAILVRMTRFDSVGNVLWARTAFAAQHYDGRTLLAQAIVDVRGFTLALFEPGDLVGQSTPQAARWYDALGDPATVFFALPGVPSSTPSSQVSLRPTIDGGVAIAFGEKWIAAIKSGETKLDEAPAWLATNPGSDFEIIRQRNAYAVMLSDSAPRNMLKLYSPSGRLCGRVSFDTGSVSMGSDGTVIGADGEGGCIRPFWPALLR